jgi:uncharacterized membrane protein YfcA
MRIAVLILGLLLGLVMFMQTFVGGILSSIGDDETMQQAFAVGILVSLLWLAGCALILPFPLASVISFVIAALFAFAISGDYPDMGVWGTIALILAAMSFFGWLGKRKERREKRAERQRQEERDARLESLLTQQRAAVDIQAPCPSCGQANSASSRFCGNCGAALSPQTA